MVVMEARKNKSGYIELELVRSTNPHPSPSPSPSPSSSYVRMDLENPKRSRSPKKWAGKGEKHMDFEFVKPHGSTTFMAKRHHVMMGGETSLGEGEGEREGEGEGEEGMEIQASADKLFFKGQLLPLEQDPRLHVLVQTLSQGENHEEEEEEEELVHHSCSIDDGVKSRSCTDASRGDLSFRSQQSSSYWGCNSEEKDSSNSSSRCSNGSSQDSLPHKTMSFHPQPTMHSCNPRPNSSSKAWSWKTLLTKLWSDTSPHNQRPSKSSDSPPEKYRTSRQARGLESLGEEGPNRTNHFIGFGFSSGDRDEKPPRKQQLDNLVKIGTNAKESWHRCVAKMKRPILVYTRNKKKKKKKSFLSVHFGREESYSHGSFNMTKSLSNTPLTKSPMRDYDSIIYGMGPSSSSKYIHLGCTSSCPGSLISSPHHSGVLGSSSFNNNLAHSSSSLRDLHLAIQGAIDHCKQSQCVKTLG